MKSLSDTTPLESDRLDPRGTDWRNVDQDEARTHAQNIRRVLNNALGFAPEIVVQICQETNDRLRSLDPNMYVATFQYLNASERRQFKSYLGASAAPQVHRD